MKALGGSNYSTWYSTERDIVAVDSKGYLTGLTLGTSSIIVEDRNNPLNSAKTTVCSRPKFKLFSLAYSTQVVVGNVPPISLRASSSEVLVGSTISLQVGMWDWTGLTREGGQYDCFSCESASIVWDVQGDSFFVDETNPNSFVASDTEPLKGYVKIELFWFDVADLFLGIVRLIILLLPTQEVQLST